MRLCAYTHGPGVIVHLYYGRLANWSSPLDFGHRVCDHKDMRKAITRNQRKLLDGLCDRWEFTQQIELASEIWGTKYKEIRRSFSRLSNLGFIEWIPKEQTSFEPRWWVTEKGVRYLLDNE